MIVEFAHIADMAAITFGVAGSVWVLVSALRTVVLPRPERVWMTTTAFEIGRRTSRFVSRRISNPHLKHRVLGTFAPTILVTLPVLWAMLLIFFFATIFWGLNVGNPLEALELSGSSLTTLGFITAPTSVTRLLATVEALIGLAIVTLIISFLPTLYGTFSRREIAVGRLTTRAGDPPDPAVFISRLHNIGLLDQVGVRWDEWEDWFVELGETHTTFPALVFFRSPRPERSWVTAAETALDLGALIAATKLVPKTGYAGPMIRSGYLALRSIADFYEIEPELDPAISRDISVTEDEFNKMFAVLERGGVNIEVDRETAWHAFAGWRVNYDRAIVGLADLVHDVPSHWDQYRTDTGPTRQTTK